MYKGGSKVFNMNKDILLNYPINEFKKELIKS